MSKDENKEENTMKTHENFCLLNVPIDVLLLKAVQELLGGQFH